MTPQGHLINHLNFEKLRTTFSQYFKLYSRTYVKFILLNFEEGIHFEWDLNLERRFFRCRKSTYLWHNRYLKWNGYMLFDYFSNLMILPTPTSIYRLPYSILNNCLAKSPEQWQGPIYLTLNFLIMDDQCLFLDPHSKFTRRVFSVPLIRQQNPQAAGNPSLYELLS